jgi:hypothetical protein
MDSELAILDPHIPRTLLYEPKQECVYQKRLAGTRGTEQNLTLSSSRVLKALSVKY